MAPTTEPVFFMTGQESDEINTLLDSDGFTFRTQEWGRELAKPTTAIYLISIVDGEPLEAHRIHRDPHTNVIVFNDGDDFDWDNF